MNKDPAAPTNRLLAALPTRDWDKMRSSFEEVELPSGKFLFEAGEPLRRLYFPRIGVISSVAVFETGSAEMATIGREGMVAAEAIVGGDTALSRHFV